MFNKNKKLDIWIVTEVFFHLMSIGQIKPSPDLPAIQKTLLGWIVAGKPMSVMWAIIAVIWILLIQLSKSFGNYSLFQMKMKLYLPKYNENMSNIFANLYIS